MYNQRLIDIFEDLMDAISPRPLAEYISSDSSTATYRIYFTRYETNISLDLLKSSIIIKEYCNNSYKRFHTIKLSDPELIWKIERVLKGKEDEQAS